MAAATRLKLVRFEIVERRATEKERERTGETERVREKNRESRLMVVSFADPRKVSGDASTIVKQLKLLGGNQSFNFEIGSQPARFTFVDLRHI